LSYTKVITNFTRIMAPQTLEQRVAHLEAELERIHSLLQTDSTANSRPDQLNPIGQPATALTNGLPFGVFANDPYFDEIIQRLRAERELDADNPAYT
jgi:hypothetical protein